MVTLHQGGSATRRATPSSSLFSNRPLFQGPPTRSPLPPLATSSPPPHRPPKHLPVTQTGCRPRETQGFQPLLAHSPQRLGARMVRCRVLPRPPRGPGIPPSMVNCLPSCSALSLLWFFRPSLESFCFATKNKFYLKRFLSHISRLLF